MKVLFLIKTPTLHRNTTEQTCKFSFFDSEKDSTTIRHLKLQHEASHINQEYQLKVQEVLNKNDNKSLHRSEFPFKTYSQSCRETFYYF